MNEKEISIKELVISVLRYRVLIIVVTLLALIGTAAVNFMIIPPSYTATASIYVLNQQSLDMISVNDLNSSAQLVNDYREIMMSQKVLREVAQALEMDYDELEAGYKIDVTSVTNTRVMSIAVTGHSAYMAANIANEIAAKSAQAVIDIMDAKNVSFIDVAFVPEKPSGPSKEKNIAIAAAAGFALSVMFAIGKELLDTSIKTTEDVEEELGLPVLAIVPNFSTNGKQQRKGA